MAIEWKDEYYDRQCKKQGETWDYTPIATRPIPYTKSSSRSPLVKGDHHKDLAYNATFTDVKEFFDNGSYRVDVYTPRKSLCESKTDKMNWFVGSVDTKACFLSSSGVSGTWPSIVLPPADGELIEYLRKAATTQALADARTGLMNLPMLIKERKETIQLIRDKTTNIAQLATQRGRADVARYFRSDKRSRRMLQRQIADEHLSFLFGILPLIEEVEGLIGVANGEVPKHVFTGRGKRAEVTVDIPPPVIWQAGANRVLGMRFMPRRTVRYSVRVSLKYKVTVEGLSKWQKAGGFNPVAAVYDFIPLSFVSDFVSNTGNFLRSYDPTFGAEFSTGCWTLYRSVTVDGYAFPQKTDMPGTYEYSTHQASGRVEAQSVAIQRTPYHSEPEQYWFFQNNMSLAKAATGASLAVQRYLKPLQRVVAQKPFRYKGSRPKYQPPINYR